MNTPRTDAVYPPDIIDREFAEQGRDFGWGVLHDMRECSRQLERELIAMTALADRLAKTLWKVSNCRMFYEESLDIDNYTTDEVKEALAAYENHKKQTP